MLGHFLIVSRLDDAGVKALVRVDHLALWHVSLGVELFAALPTLVSGEAYSRRRDRIGDVTLLESVNRLHCVTRTYCQVKVLHTTVAFKEEI